MRDERSEAIQRACARRCVELVRVRKRRNASKQASASGVTIAVSFERAAKEKRPEARIWFSP